MPILAIPETGLILSNNTTGDVSAAKHGFFPKLASVADAKYYVIQNGLVVEAPFLQSVTVHSILSTTHGDTTAAAVARGSIIVGDATPKWVNLAFPATPTGKVLIATATDVAWSTSALGTAAYTPTGDYATAAQGTLATNAIPKGVGTAVGDLVTFSGASTPVALADVVVGSYLRSGGVATQPLWSTLKLPNAGTAFRLPVFSSANTMTELTAVGATGEYLAGATGAIPAWATLNATAVGLGSVTNDAQVKLSTVTTKGDLIVASGNAAVARLGAGASAGSLRTDGAGNWSIDTTAYLSSVTAHNLLSTTHGDTTAAAVARGSIIVGDATPKWVNLAFPATPTGKVLIATATDVAWSTSALGTAAYTPTGDYATAAQGTLATNAIPKGVGTAVGDLVTFSGASTPVALADVVVGSYLRSGGVATQPLWSTLKLPNAGTAFRLPVFSSANTMTELTAVGATGEYLAGATGAIPAWATLNATAVGLGSVTNDAQVKLSTVTTKGDLIVASGNAAVARLGAGASAGNLRTDGAGNWSIDTTSYLSSLSGALLATGVTTGATSQSQVFTNGVTVSTLSVGRVTYAGASGVLTDSSNFMYNGIGLYLKATGASPVVSVACADDVNGVYPFVRFDRSKGTLVAPTDVVAGYVCGGVNFYGLVSPALVSVASFAAFVDAVVGANLKGYLNFAVSDGTTTGANTDVFRAYATDARFYKYLNADTRGVAGTATGINEAIRITYKNGTPNGGYISWKIDDGGSTETGRIEHVLPGGAKSYFAFSTFNAATLSEKMRIDGDGNVGIGVPAPATKLDVGGSSQNSSAVASSFGGYVRTFSEAVGTPAGTTTYFDIPVNVPSGCKLLGVQLRVDTALTAGETWGAAYATGSTTVLAAPGQAVAKNTKVNKMHVDEISTATTVIRITRDSGNFTNATGVIRAICYYETFTAMGSL